MTKFKHLLKSRIGTCRSGTPFDILHEFDEGMVENYLSDFDIDDQIDIFCMCEAFLGQAKMKNEISTERERLYVLNKYLWRDDVRTRLKPYLEAFGLKTSPDFVRFGQTMLLLSPGLHIN